jgi:isoleucyl-tRNA synthetase
MASDTKKNYKDTLNLPTTEFPIRFNPRVEDKKILKRWEQEELYTKTFKLNAGNTPFILAIGPPYANGPIHLGHAYNNILKDIVGKSQRMQKKHVPITPGWDCHGLPIELKVSQELAGKQVSYDEFIAACRAYASKWVDIQRDELKQLGVLMDWPNPYLTMNYGYEASILQALGIFLEKDFVERKNKTVPWCASCETVLANAEIEYQERKDPSIYVPFRLDSTSSKTLFPEHGNTHVSVLIWTTTPWTLPLNRAVLLNPKAEYSLITIKDKFIVIGKDLAQPFCDRLEVPYVLLAIRTGQQLLDAKPQLQHPLIADLQVPLIPSETVETKEGTAFVHCAPGCGPEDYEIGIRYGLEIFSPLSPAGSYTCGITPRELEGISIKDGQIWVMKQLALGDNLLYKSTVRHSYPHCWRCHQGLMFRATKQWFIDLQKHDLKERTINALDTIVTYPKKAHNRLKATLEGRLEWCVSRQRIWGVPIPALICTTCDTAYSNKAFVDSIAQQVAEHGVEYWHNTPIEELVVGIMCSACGENGFKKETDILDVWFDSGVSHYAVLCKRPELQFPANMYLEGKDQHRGWFQSSLLTSMVIEKEPAMRSILTHGFTVDKEGKKMSKSLGNVITPWVIADTKGMDVLRLWVSSIDYTDDAVISDILLKNIQEVFRKIRNTLRFLLSNVHDFQLESDTIPLDQLNAIDQYALYTLSEFNKKIIAYYNAYDFTAIFHAFADYCASDLSSLYLDIVKDRLYVEKKEGRSRRSAQTVCWYLLDTLTHLIAPIMSFTAEQISDHFQPPGTESIHLQPFSTPPHILVPIDQWDALLALRSAVLKAIEKLREQGVVKHSLEVDVSLYLDPYIKDSALLQTFLHHLHIQTAQEFVKEFCIVSNVSFLDMPEKAQESTMKGLFIEVKKMEGEKCPRCWHWSVAEHKDGLCQRCENIVLTLNKELGL